MACLLCACTPGPVGVAPTVAESAPAGGIDVAATEKPRVAPAITRKKNATRPAPATPAAINVVIDGPDSVTAGDLIRLDASATDADSFRWLLVGIDRGRYDVAEENRKIYFATNDPGDYTFVLSASKRTESDLLHELREHVVTVTADGPASPPAQPPAQPPTPPPATPPTSPPTTPPSLPPVVTPPANVPELTSWAATNATALVVDDPNRGATATALATTFRTWANMGGIISDPRQYITGSNQVLDRVLKPDPKARAWKEWRDALEQKLSTSGLATVADHVRAWRDIAAGLDLVR